MRQSYFFCESLRANEMSVAIFGEHRMLLPNEIATSDCVLLAMTRAAGGIIFLLDFDNLWFMLVFIVSLFMTFGL